MNCFPKTCCGIDALTGRSVEIRFGDRIETVAAAGQAADFLAPAFIDVQVNGFAGVDFNSPASTHEAISRATRAIRSTGVSRYFPTVITGSAQNMTASLRNLAAAAETIPERHSIAGFHVEGPHIAPEDGPRGAHPLEWVRPPDIDLFHRLQEAAGGRIRLVTVSPHWPAAPAYIEALVKRDVTVSIGHTSACADQLDAAVRAGARLSTHIGNGAHQVLRRHPNYLWDQLADDRLTAGLIVDGKHLGAAFLKVALRAKTPARAYLVTDASAPAGCAPGRYHLGQQVVDLTPDGRVVLAGQDRLAGSALRMDDAIANVMAMTGMPLPDALSMATIVPARACRIPGRENGLVPGDCADIVEFSVTSGRIKVTGLYIDGEHVAI